MNGTSKLLAVSMLVLAFALPSLAASLINLAVNTNSSTVGANSTYNFSFNTTALIYNLTVINITFPSGYNINNTQIGNVSINDGKGHFPNTTAIFGHTLLHAGCPPSASRS